MFDTNPINASVSSQSDMSKDLSNDVSKDLTISEYSETTPLTKEDSSETESKEKKNTNDDDGLFLTPIYKYAIYNHFPYSFIVHILLAIFTSLQVFKMDSAYTRAQERQIYHYFLSDNDLTDFDYKRSKYFFTINELKAFINETKTKYFNLEESFFEKINYGKERSTPEELSFINYQPNKMHDYPYLIAKFMPSSHETKSNRKYIYKLEGESLGPFDNKTEIKSFLKNITNFQINYTFTSYVPMRYADVLECYNWEVDQLFNFAQRGHFTVGLRIERTLCLSDNAISFQGFLKNFLSKSLFIHYIVFFLSVLSLFLAVHRIYVNAPKELKKEGTFIQLFFNRVGTWAFIALTGNIIQIYGSIFHILDISTGLYTKDLS
ncbi:MAG: hypothetical protein MJ252_25120, partial [archaeon]|nr:hypothetical protein [archaeon]